MKSKKNNNCISCLSSKLKTIGEIPQSDIFAGRIIDSPLDPGLLYRCDSCKLVFRFPRLEKDKLDQLYKQGKEDNWQDSTKERYDWAFAKSIIEKDTDQKILDIGCFDGTFLSQFSETNRLFGIEINKGASDRARKKGINIIHDDFESLSSNKYKFNIITSFDVIEHTLDPFLFLKSISKNVLSNGLIIVSSGNSDAPTWKLSKAKYWYCTINEHISFINPMWAKIAANKLNLELLQIKKIRHKKTTTKRKVMEAIANLIYWTSPKLYSFIRKNIPMLNEPSPQSSFSFKTQNKHHNELTLLRPPSWISSKDHVICVFRKK